MVKVKISVTQEDIDQGEPTKAMFCPVAIAFNRETGFTANVHWDIIYYGPNNFDKQVDTPEVVQVFIEDFDNGESVSPFEFELELED